MPDIERVGLYVDGFNLYHAIDDLRKPYLKWLCLKSLGEKIIQKRTQKLERVVYCSAFSNNAEKSIRHNQYVEALRHYEVIVKLGHFADDERSCRACNSTWIHPVEKQTDMNLGLSAFIDAHDGLYDRLFLLTADTDQAATLRVIGERLSHIKITCVFPPGRAPAKKLKDLAHNKIVLNEDHIMDSLLPKFAIKNIGGREVMAFQRPSNYDPPYEVTRA